MRIAGFDISTVATGWAVVEDGTLIEAGVIRPIDELKAVYKTKQAAREALDESDIFRHITRRAGEIIERVKPDNIVVEDCFLKDNASTLRMLSRLSGGVLHQWTEHHSRKPHVVMASHARASLGCNGTAKKTDVMAFLKLRYGVDLADDNIADAFVLALYGDLKDRQAPSEANARRGRRIRRRAVRVHGTA